MPVNYRLFRKFKWYPNLDRAETREQYLLPVIMVNTPVLKSVSIATEVEVKLVQFYLQVNGNFIKVLGCTYYLRK